MWATKAADKLKQYIISLRVLFVVFCYIFVHPFVTSALAGGFSMLHATGFCSKRMGSFALIPNWNREKRGAAIPQQASL